MSQGEEPTRLPLPKQSDGTSLRESSDYELNFTWFHMLAMLLYDKRSNILSKLFPPTIPDFKIRPLNKKPLTQTTKT